MLLVAVAGRCALAEAHAVVIVGRCGGASRETCAIVIRLKVQSIAGAHAIVIEPMSDGRLHRSSWCCSAQDAPLPPLKLMLL